MMEKLELSHEMEAAERAKLEQEIRAKQEEVQRIQSEVEAKDAEARRLQAEFEAAKYGRDFRFFILSFFSSIFFSAQNNRINCFVAALLCKVETGGGLSG